MVLLTNILTPIIILSSFNEKPGYRNSFYGLILLMQFGVHFNWIFMTRSSDLFHQAQEIIPGGVNSPVRAFKGVGGIPIFFNSSY